MNKSKDMTNYLKMLNIFEKNIVIIHKSIENHGSKQSCLFCSQSLLSHGPGLSSGLKGIRPLYPCNALLRFPAGFDYFPPQEA